MSEEVNGAQVLARAQELISECGWRQGSFGNPRTGYCLEGALYAAEWDVEGVHAAWRSEEFLSKWVGEMGSENTVEWNDAPERTEADVLDLLAAARTRLAEREGETK